MSDIEAQQGALTTDPAADDVRPWDDPDDPKPEAFEDGRWRSEFIDWAKRSGRRRWLYYFGPGGIWEDQAPLIDAQHLDGSSDG